MRFLIPFLFMGICHVYGQADSAIRRVDRLRTTTPVTTRERNISVRNFIVPVTLITYGVFSQANEDLRDFDTDIKGVVRRDPDFSTKIDNYIQYAPGLSVYALNAVGIKGSHDFHERTVIYLLSNTIMSLTVQSIKAISKVQRPDGGGTNAFPSGHTATAFAGAEFLRQEYQNVSPWYGIAGYGVATTTGVLRMFNNVHWFRDVVAGAGIGILSTKLAYMLAPVIEKKLFNKRHSYHSDVLNY